MIASEGKILFKVVRDAMKRAGIILNQNDPRALLVWYDTIKDDDYFSNLKPWQVVNRLPNINLICRKAPFVRMIQRIQMFEPELYNFLPKSYILPIDYTEFSMELMNPNRKKILIKPDNGSLGSGITIINPGQKYTCTNNNLAIAQEYIDSYLINNRKFDLRIYALVASITPLKIYVFRNGVARFCSEESNFNTIYAQLTNTAVNRKHTNGDISTITKMVKETFDIMKRDGVNIDLLWSKIDKAIVLTILSSYQYLIRGQELQCKPTIYSKCFQILGFDVLIDPNLNPYILEVNYRPSLDTDTSEECSMKMQMLSEAMRIAAPLKSIQKYITDEKLGYTTKEWQEFVDIMPRLKAAIHDDQASVLNDSSFVQVFPSTSQQLNMSYLSLIDKVRHMGTEIQNNYRIPCTVNPHILAHYLALHPPQKKKTQTMQIIPKKIKNSTRSANLSKLLMNKYVSTPKSKTSLSEKIPIPEPKRINNKISFSLQAEIENQNIRPTNLNKSKSTILNDNKTQASEEKYRSKSVIAQSQGSLIAKPKKSIKKPALSRTGLLT